MFTVEQIVERTAGTLIGPQPSAGPVSGISTDTRTLQPGELFVALTGPRFDGHAFIPDAMARGAIGIIASRSWVAHATPLNGTPLIAVEDPLAALQALAHDHWRRWRPRTIVVTGSAGKTTTKELIAAVLTEWSAVAKAPLSYNNAIGVPLTLLAGGPPQRAVVLEYGANHPGEIAALCRMASPEIAVITNIGPAHLEFFKTLRGVLKAKWAVVEALRQDGLAVLNGDDPLLRQAAPSARARVVTFGFGAACQWRATRVAWADGGTTFTCARRQWTLPLVGRHNVLNALAAMAVGRSLGVSHDAIWRALSGVRPITGRMQMIEDGEVRWINDSYNANPLSFERAIQALCELAPPARRMVVLGDMLELGRSSRRWHERAGRLVARSGVDRLITIGEASQAASETARRAGLSASARHCASVEDAREALTAWQRPGDWILVKGSHAMALDQLLPCSTSSSIR